MQIKYPRPGELFISHSEEGSKIEGRADRQGYGSMKLGSLCKYHSISDINWSLGTVPELPNMSVRFLNYRVHVKTFCPISVLGEIKRWDTLSHWYLSYQEELRHLANASTFVNSEYWIHAEQIFLSVYDSIWDILLSWIDGVTEYGDMSYDQFIFYAKEHSDSAAPWEGVDKWADLFDKDMKPSAQLKTAYEVTKAYIYEFQRWMHSYHPDYRKRLLIRAQWLYPGVRARPGDYVVNILNEFEAVVYVTKWRDRKVGGVQGLSQLAFPIYKTDGHTKLMKRLQDKLSSIGGFKIHGLESEGPQLFLDLLKYPNITTLDLKTAEKQSGKMLESLGVAADLGAAGFDEKLAGELYSGESRTPLVNEIFLALIMKSLMEVDDFQIQEAWFFSDNVAVNGKLPHNVHLDEADTFCGWSPKLSRFFPVSVSTDNPKHRLVFKPPKQVQAQRVQYFMKPLLSVIMNSIAHPSDAVKFLEYAVNNEKIAKALKEDADSYRKDHLAEVFMSLDREEHLKFADKFPEAKDFVSRWFVVQDQQPNYVSDWHFEPT